jgi:hypothetical protein
MVVGDKKFGVVSYVIGGGTRSIPPERFCIFPLLGLHFVRFLKQIFGHTELHYTVDRLNLQLSTCVICLC